METIIGEWSSPVKDVSKGRDRVRAASVDAEDREVAKSKGTAQACTTLPSRRVITPSSAPSLRGPGTYRHPSLVRCAHRVVAPARGLPRGAAAAYLPFNKAQATVTGLPISNCPIPLCERRQKCHARARAPMTRIRGAHTDRLHENNRLEVFRMGMGFRRRWAGSGDRRIRVNVLFGTVDSALGAKPAFATDHHAASS